MPSAHLTLREEDVVRLTLEFLHNRHLHISQLSIERETGVINGAYSDDVLFLRQLVLDGQWDDVLEFIQPLEALPAFDMKRFRFTVLRHKYVELLCIKSEASGNGSSVDSAVEEVVKVLNELESVSPSKEDYSNLCLLLTLPRLSDHLQYKDWNPSNARVQCFRDVFPLVEKFLPGDRKTDRGSAHPLTTAKNDRLVQLIIKGILYESCVTYCQAKATGTRESQHHEMNFARLLDGSVGFNDSDLSLLSWLQSIPPETFSVPFEQRTLNVDVETLERPSLETSWTEHMLVTPIKPKTFPHSAMPFTRPRSAADIMSRSLLPALEGSPSVSRMNRAALMALSTGDIISDPAMSRSSFASFHLTGHKNNKLMNTSVDRLFDNDHDVFLSSSYTEFQLPSISETHSTPVQPRTVSPEKKPVVASNASTPEHRSTSASTSTTARSSRRDSLSDKNFSSACTTMVADNSFDGALLKEYQKQKRMQESVGLVPKEEISSRIQEDRYLATGCTFTSLAFYFARGQSTVIYIVREITQLIWQVLNHTYMLIPKEEQWKTIAQRFYTLWNLPNCLGAVDGKHIRIEKLPGTGSTNFNYKQYHSIVLMACSDADGFFTTIETGYAGRNSDGGIFRASVTKQWITGARSQLPSPSRLPDDENECDFPYYFVEDEAFPLARYLMRPYPQRTLDNTKRIFNYRLSRGRKCVECAFGMMTKKFQVLSSPIRSRTTKRVVDIIKSVCILHNFIRRCEGIQYHSDEPQQNVDN